MNCLIEKLDIDPPKGDGDNDGTNNKFIFNIKNDGKPLTFESNENYAVNCDDISQSLSIPTPDELQYFNSVYLKLKQIFLEKHEEWFEEKFTDNALENLFENFLKPNIAENCINLNVFLEQTVIDKLKQSVMQNNTTQIKPVFLFENITLNTNDNVMFCKVVITSYQTDKLEMDENNANQEILEVNVEEHGEIQDKTGNNQNEGPEEDGGEKNEGAEKTESGQKDEGGEEEGLEEELTVNKKNNVLEEVEFDVQDLDNSEIILNEEDYFIIYKYMLDQIKECKIREVEKLCDEKGISSESINYEEIFDDGYEDDLTDDDSSIEEEY